MIHLCKKDQQDAHIFLISYFKLDYPEHMSKKWLFIIRKSLPAAYSISSCFFIMSLVTGKVCIHTLPATSWWWTIICSKHVEDNLIWNKLLRKSVHLVGPSYTNAQLNPLFSNVMTTLRGFFFFRIRIVVYSKTLIIRHGVRTKTKTDMRIDT